MTRKTCTIATAISAAFAAGSFAVTMLESQNIDGAALMGGAIGVLVACMAICTNYVAQVTRKMTSELRADLRSEISAVNRPADKAYELGYEMGYDKAWNEARIAEQPRRIGLATVDGEAVSG